jgi:hypothetical protein
MPSPDRTDDRETEAAMKSPHTNNDSESLDHRSSRAICDAVGERLRQVLRPGSTDTSSHLQHLIDELRRRDEAGGRNSH